MPGTVSRDVKVVVKLTSEIWEKLKVAANRLGMNPPQLIAYWTGKSLLELGIQEDALKGIQRVVGEILAESARKMEDGVKN